jgi:predicted nucleic acid-binding protein
MAASKVFLDTSALFAGPWSREGGARLLLQLGEAGVLQLRVSALVLEEIERALREKAPETLGRLALVLDRSRLEVAPKPRPARVRQARKLVRHPGDALVIAAAWDAGVDYFVTLDRKHFLDNRALRAALPFPMGTPGDCVAWLRGALGSQGVSRPPTAARD